MRIHLEHNGTVFEYERHPLPERRFCALAAVGGYVGMVAVAAALCGISGLLAVVAGTVLVVVIASA